MGGQIAQAIASSDIPVVVKDVDQKFVDHALEEVRNVTAGQLGSLVKKEKITQEQADARLAEITARITDHVNNGGPAEGMEGRGGRRHHGPDAGDFDGPDAEGADTSA